MPVAGPLNCEVHIWRDKTGAPQRIEYHDGKNATELGYVTRVSSLDQAGDIPHVDIRVLAKVVYHDEGK